MKAGLKVAKHAKLLLSSKFEEFNQAIFQSMRWIDRKFWDENQELVIEEIFTISNHFSVPLQYQGFQLAQAVKEWKQIKIVAKRNYPMLETYALWKKIIVYHGKEYPNIVMLAKLVLVISGSNSAVERQFSKLTLVLSDRRLGLSHENIENVLLLKGNDKLWSQTERNQIINGAVNNYLKKRRKLTEKVTDNNENNSVMEESLTESTEHSDSDEESIEYEERNEKSDECIESDSAESISDLQESDDDSNDDEFSL